MAIIVSICIILLFLLASGYGIASILLNQFKHRLISSLFIGYVATQVIFGIFIVVSANYYISYTLALSPLLITMIVFYKSYKNKHLSCNILYRLHLKEKWIHLYAILFIVIQTAWPLLLANTIENYWHSGAVDLVEDVFIKSLHIYNEGKYGGEYGAGLIFNHLLQYTSPAFWYILFKGPSVGVVLLQYIVLLILMYFGVYIFAREIILFNKLEAILAGLLSTTSAFYSASFANYHGGTMMFLSMIFYFLWLIMSVNKEPHFVSRPAIIFFTFITFFLLSYNYALLFFYSFGLVVFLATKHLQVFSFINRSPLLNTGLFLITLLVGLLAIITITYYSKFYMVTYDIFDFDYPGSRAWEAMRSSLAPLFYFGLIPQLLMGSGYPYHHEIYSNKILLLLLFSLSAYIAIPTLVGAIRLSANNAYFKYTFITITAFFPIFFLFLDPYYTYKLLYTTQPMFVMALIYAFKSRQVSNKNINISVGQVVTFRWIGLSVFILIAIINFSYTTYANLEIRNRWYNKNPEIFETVLDIPNDIINQSYLLTSAVETKWIIAAFLLQHQKEKFIYNISNAKYLLTFQHWEEEDVGTIKGKLINSWGDFSLYPAENFIVFIPGEISYHQAEKENNKFQSRAISWLYDERTKDGGIIYEMNFYGKLAKKNYCLLFGVEPGPAISYMPFILNYKLNEEEGIIKVNGSNFYCLPIVQKNNDEIKFNIAFIGDARNDLFPIEQRRLVAKVNYLDIIDQNDFNDYYWQLLNPAVSNPQNTVLFGNGWHAIESEDFRWSGGDSEILVIKPSSNHLKLSIELEPGPSLAYLPMDLSLLDANGKVIGSSKIYRKDRVEFTIDINPLTTISKFILKSNSPTKKIHQDKRSLAFRAYEFELL